MALVKKLQPGGSLGSLDEELNKELGQYNLKSKDERKVRDALVKFRDYFATPEGKSFTADPLANKYTISGQGSEKFSGSPDEIRSNWVTGKLKIDNDEDAMSVAAAIYGSASKNIQGTASAGTPTGNASPSTKTKVGIGNFNNYVIDDVYGTTNNFAGDFGKLSSDEERKKTIMSHASKYVSDYLSNAEQHQGQYDYHDIDKVKNLQSAILSGDWEKFRTASYPFKWEVDDFLVKPAEKEAFDAETAAAKVAEEKAKAVSTAEQLVAGGMSKQLADLVSQRGFTGTYRQPLSMRGINITEPFNAYVKSKGWHIVTDNTGRKAIVGEDGAPVNSEGTEFDEFNPLSGIAWTHDAKGNLKFVSSKYKSKDEGDIGKGLKTNIPGYEGWDVTGWSRQSETEPVTTRDYTKYLILKKDGKTIKIAKDASGKYTLPSGETFGRDKILGYAGINTTIQHWETPTEFASIDASQAFTADRAEAAIESVTKMLEGTGEINDANKSSIKAVISTLKYQAANAKNNEDKTRALKRLSGLNELLKRENIKLKLGGVIKAQQGGGLEKYAKPTMKVPSESGLTTPTKSRDISGLVRGSSDLDKAILASNVAMLAPGWIGVGAGLVSTGLEAYKGATDTDGWTWGDSGQLALNLGLTAASFVGMGFLKGAAKGAQIGIETAKALDKAGDFEKVLKGVSSSTKGIKGSDAVKTAITGIKDFAKLNPAAKSLKELALAAETAKDTKTLADLATITTFAENLAKSKTLLQLPSFGKAAKATAKGVRYAGTAAAIGGAAANMGTVVDAAGKIVSGNAKDLSLDEIGAMTSVLFAGKLIGTHAKIKVGKKYGLESTKKTPASLETTVKGKKMIIEDPETIGKLQKLKIPFKESNVEIKKEFITKHNTPIDAEIAKLDTVKDAIKIKTLENSKATLDDLKSTKIKFNEASESGFRVKRNIDVGGDQSYVMQQLGMRWANRYGLAPNAKKVATSGWGKTKEFLMGTTNPNYKTPNPPTGAEKAARLAFKESRVVLARDASGAPTKFHKTLKNKDLPKRIQQVEVKQAKKSSDIGQRELANRKKQLEAYVKEYQALKKHELGGVIKYGDGTGKEGVAQTSNISLGTLDPKSLQIIAKNKARLNYNPKGVTPGIFDDKGEYTPEFIEIRKKITPEWFNANKDAINKKIAESGSTYKVETPEQLVAGASDYKPGILHDIVLSTARDTTPMTPMASKELPKTPINPAFVPAAKGTDIVADIQQKPGAWDQIKGYINPTSVANSLMYANTVNTNRQVGNLQRQAIANSLYQLPYMPHSYLRVDRPNALQASKQAAEVRSQGKAVAAATSDLDRSTATRLQGEKLAQDVIEKGQTADLSRFDKLRSLQAENDASINQYNTQVLGKNRGLAAEAFKQIPLITANQKLSNASALNNLIVAGERNYGVNRYKNAMDEYWKMSNDPKVKAAGETYSVEAGDIGRNKAMAEYELEKESLKGTDKAALQFEESEAFKNWEGRKLGLEKNLSALLEPIRTKQSWLQHYQPLIYMKKGGTALTKEEKIDIDNAKFNNAKRLKDTEWAYKAIMHNNEMLQKALIKVFK